MQKTCIQCGVEFVVAAYREGTARFCCLKCFQKYRSDNGFQPYLLASKTCRYCGESFTPKTGRAVTCYRESCRSKVTKDWRARYDTKRTAARRKIQANWGYTNSRHLGCRGGKSAEEAAPRFLRELDFTNIIEMTTRLANFPWDVLAERDGQKYAIQVTMRTHTVHRYFRATAFLDLNWAVLFVKPDLTHAVLKVPRGHTAELTAKEVMPYESCGLVNNNIF